MDTMILNPKKLARAAAECNSVFNVLRHLASHSSHVKEMLEKIQHVRSMLMDFEPTHVEDGHENDPIKVDQHQFLKSFTAFYDYRIMLRRLDPFPSQLHECTKPTENLMDFFEQAIGDLRRSGHSKIHDHKGTLKGVWEGDSRDKLDIRHELPSSSHHDAHHDAHHVHHDSHHPPPVPPRHHTSHGSHDSHSHHTGGAGKKPMPAPRTKYKKPPLPPKRSH